MKKSNFLKFQGNKWKDIFKPKRKAGQEIEKDEKKKSKREQADPHVSLVCGHRLARGTKSYKERHWNQKHANYESTNPNVSFHGMIMPENNQKAREFLQQQNAAVASNAQGKVTIDQRGQPSLDINEDELENIRPIAPMSPLRDEPSQYELYAVSHNSAPLQPSSDPSFIIASHETQNTNPDLSAYAKPSAPGVNSKQGTVKSVVTGYFKAGAEKAPEAFTLEKFQDDLNKILLKVDALSLESRSNKTKVVQKVSTLAISKQQMICMNYPALPTLMWKCFKTDAKLYVCLAGNSLKETLS